MHELDTTHREEEVGCLLGDSSSEESTVALICRILELHDPHTAAHHRRVAELSTAVGVGLSLEPNRVQSIRYAALIHDVGKISIPMQLLVRPAPLTALEWQFLRAHAQIGHDLVQPVDSLRQVAVTVLHHHERLDGSGYPQGLRHDEIGIDARVLAVADVVEAMSTHRPYRNALGLDAALDEVAAHSGTLFDPDVVSVCTELFESEGFEFSVPTRNS